jgi:predicted ATPase/class 3 adenylate cyclase
MTNLPTGTVTFLFTDIEGSTKLAQAHPDHWPQLQERHHALLRHAIEAHNGYVFQIIGDAFCTAFSTAPDALNAAVEAQHALGREAWGTDPILVRMGIHTGVAQAGAADAVAGGYTGYASLALVQRVMSAAHGGQILLSHTTADLVGDQLSGEITLRDLGEHHLKGLLRPEKIWQVVAPDLPQDFPALASLTTPTNNLPTQLTTFIGRERELKDAQAKLETSRLLTLIGPGGTGKTRLSLQIAAEQLARFEDGVWFVELAPISDPAYIVSTIATVFDVREAQGIPLINLLVDYLRAKELLLALDNCEHLVEACAHIADQLLHACPKLKIIASSREALGIDGETVYRVPSLSLPEHSSSDLMNYEATRLFVERATKAEPRFHATAENAAAVIQICRRLDGIPLAIELAAARIKLFTPVQIAERLDDRFKLLTGGSRTALPRQQTLRALIDWSYNSLNETEQRALRRLAVFLGGWAIEGAEAVIGEAEAIDGLLGLVNKSLVNVDEQSGAARYRFLETIRQYAMDKLLESGEAVESRNRHLDYVLKLTGEAEQSPFGTRRLSWLDHMEMEHDNLRAALDWSSSNNLEKAIKLALALGAFWNLRGYATEGVAWCQTILARAESQPLLAGPRARLDGVLAQAAIFSGNHQLARVAADAGVILARQVDDKSAIVRLQTLAATCSMYLGDSPAAQQYLRDAEGLAREQGYRDELAVTLMTRSQIVYFTGGDMAQAKAYVAEAMSLAGEGNSEWVSYMFVFLAARLSGTFGDIEKARGLFGQAEDGARRMGDMRTVYSCQSELAHMLRKHGEIDAALELYKQVLPKWKELGHRSAVAHELECIAFILNQKGQPERAVPLIGAAQVIRELIDSSMTPRERVEYDRVISELRAGLNEDKFKQLWDAGRAMSMEQAIDYALA